MIATRHTSTTPIAKIEKGSRITIEQFVRIVRDKATIELDSRVLEDADESHELLQTLLANGHRIYGVNTGFGPLVSETVASGDETTNQENLIAHLACGIGPIFDEEQSRAILLARIVSLSNGLSAISSKSLAKIASLFNKGIIPCIPQMGTVGASGDLTPLAHVALAFMGKGEIWQGGEPQAAGVILKQAEEAPIQLQNREGLALVNGTSAMTGVAVLNADTASRLWHWGLRIAFLYSEIHEANKEAFHRFVGQARGHSGQIKAHLLLESWSSDSGRLFASNQRPSRPIQDLYSIRCIPQIYGAVWEAIENHQRTSENELNATTDNPLFSTDDADVFHSGNFYGLPIALASDSLTNALINLAIHAERSIAKTTDRSQNGELPPFLTPQAAGLNSGFMGAQTTATALLAELRSLAHPASIQSIPTNANNQDTVPLGTIAARKAETVLGFLANILAIEAMVMAQAFDLIERQSTKNSFSSQSKQLAAWIRNHSDFLDTDRPLSPDIDRLAMKLRLEDSISQ